jgi:hypothetical protein
MFIIAVARRDYARGVNIELQRTDNALVCDFNKKAKNYTVVVPFKHFESVFLAASGLLLCGLCCTSSIDYELPNPSSIPFTYFSKISTQPVLDATEGRKTNNWMVIKFICIYINIISNNVSNAEFVFGLVRFKQKTVNVNSVVDLRVLRL